MRSARGWLGTPEITINVALRLQIAPSEKCPHLSYRKETNCNYREAMWEIQFGINEIPEGPKTSRFSHCLKLIQHCISKVYVPTSLGVPSWSKLPHANVPSHSAVSMRDNELEIALPQIYCCLLSFAVYTEWQILIWGFIFPMCFISKERSWYQLNSQ